MQKLMKRGAVLIDDQDLGSSPRLLFYMEHYINDGRRNKSGEPVTISKQLQFVEVNDNEAFRAVGPAPYLDYRAPTDEELVLLEPELDNPWLKKDWEDKVLGYAISEVIPREVEKLKAERIAHVNKTAQQVRARLLKEIQLWDRRAQDLKHREQAGQKTKLSAANAAQPEPND